jgi:hypothetical protein
MDASLEKETSMAKKSSAALPPAQPDLFGDRNRIVMTWIQVPELAKARVLERLAQLLLASEGRSEVSDTGDGDE